MASEAEPKLNRSGIAEIDTSVSSKTDRGAFPAWFLLAVLHAIGRFTVTIDDGLEA